MFLTREGYSFTATAHATAEKTRHKRPAPPAANLLALHGPAPVEVEVVLDRKFGHVTLVVWCIHEAEEPI